MSSSEVVHYHRGPDRFELMFSLGKSQKEEPNLISFFIEREGQHLSSGEHKALVTYVERRVYNACGISALMKSSAGETIMAEGVCGTELEIPSGRWDKFIPISQTQLKIKIPNQKGLEIFPGPPKWNFLGSLFSREEQPGRVARAVITDKDGKEKQCLCKIMAIECDKTRWLFETQIKINPGEKRFSHAVGFYCTKTRKGELFPL